jgi:hypothetical protein
MEKDKLRQCIEIVRSMEFHDWLRSFKICQDKDALCEKVKL